MQETFVEANGLRFHVRECGEGPLVLCLHGFPDTPETWAGLMPEIASAGFRVAAPSMRGYAPTAIPVDGDYSVETLGNDVLALIKALGHENAVVIGHDWGALAAYAAASLGPERVTKLVTLAIPHPRVIKLGPAFLRTAWHIAFFQIRPVALSAVRRNDFALIERLYRQWSPEWDVPEAELNRVKRVLAKPGVLRAALGYYWSLGEDLANPLRLPSRRKLQEKTVVPTLMMAGERDSALPAKYLDRTAAAFLGDFQLVRFPGAGHFVHRERHEQVLDEILRFLNETASDS